MNNEEKILKMLAEIRELIVDSDKLSKVRRYQLIIEIDNLMDLIKEEEV